MGLDYQPRARLTCGGCVRREGGVLGERTFMRVGAGSLVVGTVLAFVFNLIHPRSSEALDSTRGELELVADSDIWLFDHMMLGVATAFVLVGLVALSTSMRGGDGELWARAALVAGVAGVVVIWITVVVDGMASKQVADAWARAPTTRRSWLRAMRSCK